MTHCEVARSVPENLLQITVSLTHPSSPLDDLANIYKRIRFPGLLSSRSQAAAKITTKTIKPELCPDSFPDESQCSRVKQSGSDARYNSKKTKAA